MGIDEAAELHGVRKIIEQVRRLSGILRTHEVPADEAMDGVTVAKRLKQIGVTKEKVLDFIDEVMNRCEKKAFTVSELAQCAKELSDVEVEADPEGILTSALVMMERKREWPNPFGGGHAVSGALGDAFLSYSLTERPSSIVAILKVKPDLSSTISGSVYNLSQRLNRFTRFD
ncbi:MAG: hypothetical protein ABSG92_03275 [Conexivisphaerales archaeon]